MDHALDVGPPHGLELGVVVVEQRAHVQDARVVDQNVRRTQRAAYFCDHASDFLAASDVRADDRGTPANGPHRGGSLLGGVGPACEIDRDVGTLACQLLTDGAPDSPRTACD